MTACHAEMRSEREGTGRVRNSAESERGVERERKQECVVLRGIFQGGKWSRTPFQLLS